ncbi:MAG: ParB/RepB/Spo0J family partition protein [[Clostridium] leptum]
MIPVDQIDLAEYNPAASNDTESDYYDLAMSIQANGLLQPLLLNRVSNNRYQLIAGEKRLTAIKRYIPEMKTVRALVYKNLDPDEAQIKLHEANNYREYTSEQKLKIYQDLVIHYQKLQDMGKFSGNTQKAIAECLNISDRQARKYKQITENLSVRIFTAATSINAAYDIARHRPPEREGLPSSSRLRPRWQKRNTKNGPVPVRKRN